MPRAPGRERGKDERKLAYCGGIGFQAHVLGGRGFFSNLAGYGEVNFGSVEVLSVGGRASQLARFTDIDNRDCQASHRRALNLEALGSRNKNTLSQALKQRGM